MTDIESSNTDPMAAARQLLGSEPAVEAEPTSETTAENDQAEETQADSETILEMPELSPKTTS